MKSKVIKLYAAKLTQFNETQVAFIDSVYDLAERNYSNGGDIVVETMEPKDVIEEFKTLDDVKRYIGLQVENATNFREGTDDDPELKRLRSLEKDWQD